MDMNQYLDVFVEESKEHLQNLNTSLLELEKDPNNITVLNEIFRVAHTLKGMAGTMGFSRMTRLTHDMENVLDALRSKKIEADMTVVDTLFKCFDALEGYVNEIVSTGGEGEQDYKEIIESLAGILDKSPAAKTPKKKEKKITDDKNIEQNDKELRLNLNIYDKNVILKAIEESMNIFQIHVELDNKCLLKAARAFLIFQTLDKYSEIMKSMPSVEDIEDERFDNSFTVMVITKNDESLFHKELNSIAEVRNVEVVRITEKHTENIIQDEDDEEYLQDNKPDTAALDSAAQAQRTGMAKRLTNKTVRVDIDRLDVLMNLVSELIIIKTRLDDVGMGGKTNDYITALENLERITTSLHDAVMKVRMVPVENVFNRFPRMVRDISKELKKDIALYMSGEETELDRTVIDEIGEPLIHIIRNSADHGLEKPEERIANGKSKTGSIWLRAYQDGNNVVIEVEDDGKGIDVEKVRKKIVERGFEEEEAAANMSANEVMGYLFKPNFSTADTVTDLSGRGVGLDVVKTKIEALGGTIELETELGKGSKTIIRLPLTLAIIQALLVMLGSEKYAIPLSSIREINNISPSEIKNVRNQEVTVLRDMVIPIIRLRDILGVPAEESGAAKKELTCVIVKKGEKLSGLIVDSLIGQQEIVIKSLGKLLAGIRCVAGATILGDGNVALIIDVNSIA